MMPPPRDATTTRVDPSCTGDVSITECGRPLLRPVVVSSSTGMPSAAKKPGDLIVYPDTPHGFNADYRPSYRKEAAEDGWNQMIGWFKTYKVLS